MSRRKTIIMWFLLFFLLGLSAFGVRVWSQAGQFTTVKNLRSNACQVYGGILAPEDIAIDRDTRIAYISSLDRRLVNSPNSGGSSQRGTIRALNLSTYKPGAKINYIDLTPEMPKRFHPLGLSLNTAPDGTKRLLVINQANANSQSVEIFRVTSDGLTYEKSVDLGSDVTFANDVLAVGPNQFYVTDSSFTSPISWLVNFVFQRKSSKVLYFNGENLDTVASDFVMANGISMSKNCEELYVLDTSARALRFFKRNTTNGVVVDNGVLFIGTGVDNIDVAEDGSLWMAAHPRLMDFAMYSAGIRATSSSQVIRAVKDKAGGGEVRTTYLDLGENISGSSAAVAIGNTFLIGSAMDNKLAICTRK